MIVQHLGTAWDEAHVEELKRLGERLICEREIYGDVNTLHRPRELQRRAQTLVVDLGQLRDE